MPELLVDESSASEDDLAGFLPSDTIDAAFYMAVLGLPGLDWEGAVSFQDLEAEVRRELEQRGETLGAEPASPQATRPPPNVTWGRDPSPQKDRDPTPR